MKKKIVLVVLVSLLIGANGVMAAKVIDLKHELKFLPVHWMMVTSQFVEDAERSYPKKLENYKKKALEEARKDLQEHFWNRVEKAEAKLDGVLKKKQDKIDSKINAVVEDTKESVDQQISEAVENIINDIK